MRFNNSSNSADKFGYEEFSRFLRHEGSAQGITCVQEAPKTRPLAMVYPEKQKFIKIFDPEAALSSGTMFEELYMPFNRASCRQASNKGEGC